MATSLSVEKQFYKHVAIYVANGHITGIYSNVYSYYYDCMHAKQFYDYKLSPL